MKLTKEEAVRLFHEQWSDMQKELGDCPDPCSRLEFKRHWCKTHFPEESIKNNCFLCEYAFHVVTTDRFECYSCPIAWPLAGEGIIPDCAVHMSYLLSPISEILALPVREEASFLSAKNPVDVVYQELKNMHEELKQYEEKEVANDANKTV